MSQFNTERLKQLVSYAIRGTGYVKGIELSDKIGIRIANGRLELNSMDGTNYLCVSDECVSDDIDVVVYADLFSKLISKITSETVSLTVVDDIKLEVEGNGKYTIELVPDDKGNLLSFPNKFPESAEVIGEVDASDMVAVNTTLQASLSTIAGNVYANYYFGDVIASTDRAMMAIFNHKAFNSAILFNRQFVDLMTLGTSAITISELDDTIMAQINLDDTGRISICTKKSPDIDKFEIDGIRKFVSMELKSFCRIRKAEILALLDRMSLVVSRFDDGAIYLDFTKSYLEISSLASSGVERIEYTECKEPVELKVKINIDRLRNQLKSYSSDMVDLYYGSDLCIKLVDGDMTQLIALMK